MGCSLIFLTRIVLTAMGIKSGLPSSHIVFCNPKGPLATPAGADNSSFRCCHWTQKTRKKSFSDTLSFYESMRGIV